MYNLICCFPTFQNEILKGNITDLNERVRQLESSEDSLRNKLTVLEERLSTLELQAPHQNGN